MPRTIFSALSPAAAALTPALGTLPDGSILTTYSFTIAADNTDDSEQFSLSAIKGNNNPDMLHYSVKGQDDAGGDSTYFQQQVTQGSAQPTNIVNFIQSNGASNASITFQAPTDANGDPIMTNDNPSSLADAANPPADGEAPPPPQLTEVDLICPTSGLPAGSTFNLANFGSNLRFYDSPNGGNLILGEQAGSVTFPIGASRHGCTPRRRPPTRSDMRR